MYHQEYKSLEEDLEKNKRKSSKVDIWTSLILLILIIFLFVLLFLSSNPSIVSNYLLSSYSFFMIWALYINQGIRTYFLQKETRILRKMIYTRKMMNLDDLDKELDIAIKEFRREDL